jgi:phosphohistidine phosphatase
MVSKRVLIIARHAKSSWDFEDVSDMDRHLKIRGIRDAYDMARREKIERRLPELVISSPAIRALHTASIFMRVYELNFSKMKIDSRLYGSGYSVIKQVVAEQDEKIKRIMIFGHNPDFSELATIFSGESFVDLPTCGLFRITFNAPDWKSISASNMVDTYFDFPKKV